MTPEQILQCYQNARTDVGVHIPLASDKQSQRLVDFEDIDRMLAVVGLREPFFALSNYYSGIYPFNSWPFHDKTSGCAAPRRILHEILSQDTTLILRHVHNFLPRVRALALCLQDALPTLSVQVNCYYTPPKSSGVAKHADPRDTLLIQQYGSKHWRVWEKTEKQNVIAQRGSSDTLNEGSGLPALEVTLYPGDALYIPTGCFHASTTMDDHSMHLTIGLLNLDDPQNFPVSGFQSNALIRIL